MVSVQSVVMATPPAQDGTAATKYLRAVLAVARPAGRGRYLVLHFGSGLLRTDHLGALALRALIRGRSAADAMDLVERIETGAGGRARRLIDELDARGALSMVPPWQAARHWRTRRFAAWSIGLALSIAGPIVGLTPIPILARMFSFLTSTPMANHVWRSRRHEILRNLRTSGYAGESEQWLVDVGRASAACAPSNGLLIYLSAVMSSERLDRLVDRLIDRSAADDLARRMQAAGACVGVFLHTPLCVAVPNALRARGIDVVRTVTGHSHGVNVSASLGPLSAFFGDAPEMAVELADPLSASALVRNLKAGRSVHVALETVAGARKVAAVEMLGQLFSRNDGPAWLAVRSGRPLALWTTHGSPSGVVMTASQLLHPDPSLPVAARVAALSETLYIYAEATIRGHPGAWGGWSYLDLIRGKPEPARPGGVDRCEVVASGPS
jgi:lauroyl/myristoyl acyltransferase